VRIRTAIAALSVLPLSVASVAAGSADSDPCRVDDTRTVVTTDAQGNESAVPVEFCVSNLYATCDKAVDPAVKVVDPLAAVSLSEVAPTGSFTEGDGCGAVDEPVFSATGFGGSQYQFAASGYANTGGNVDSLTFELHFLGPNGGYVGEDLQLDVKAAVDGVSLFGATVTPNAAGQDPVSSPNAARVTATPVVSSTGATVSVRFSITGIADLDERFANEAGSGEIYRKIDLAFSVPHTGQCQALPTNDTPRCAPSGFTGWVMGAVEIASGVTLNGEDADSVIVAGDQAA
jgi:hypothetical protein